MFEGRQRRSREALATHGKTAILEREIPHLEGLMARSPEAAMQDTEIIVVGHAAADEITAMQTSYNG
jgi:hypothetical protein